MRAAAFQTMETRGGDADSTGIRNCTMETIPNETILRIFRLLSIKDITACSLVCSKWHEITEDNILWRGIFSLKIEKMPVDAGLIAEFAGHTSWKLAFLCCNTLRKREHAPFWNDVDFFLNIQEVHCSRSNAQRVHCSPSRLGVVRQAMLSLVRRLPVAQRERRPHLHQFVCSPCNGLFWWMLNLKLNPTSISTPLARGKTMDDKTFRELQKAIIVLNQHCGSATFLQKLKDIAAVPSRIHFLCPQRNHVTSALLIQLSCGCVHVPTTPPVTKPWPSAMTVFTDWNKQFVAPVQDAVIQVLKTWGELAGDPELGTAIEWDRPFYWMEKLAKEKFWLGGRGKYVLDVLKQMRVKGLCINHPLHHPLNDPAFADLISPCLSAGTVARRLYTWTFHHLGKMPKLDLVNYLTGCSNTSACSVVNQFIGRYCDNLAGKVMTFCTIQMASRKLKVYVLHHIIDVCGSLKEMRDFTSLKALLSATRAALGHTQLTSLSWNNISIEHCRKFKVLEDFIDHRTGYAQYLSHVKELKKPFVPYLPAHRQQMQQQLASISPETRDNTPSLSDPVASILGLSQQAKHMCVMHPFQGTCRRNKTRVLYEERKHSYLYSFQLQEVPAAEHVMQYLSY